jgi:ABC-type phosphate transport system permease subunit
VVVLWVLVVVEQDLQQVVPLVVLLVVPAALAVALLVVPFVVRLVQQELLALDQTVEQNQMWVLMV